MHTVPPTPADLGQAQAALASAAEHLSVWRGPDTSATHVRAGHDALTAIDATLRALYDAREHLVTEIHQDNIERAARVDELLARVRAERGAGSGYDYRREPEEFATGADEPLRPGVEGWRVGGAR